MLIGRSPRLALVCRQHYRDAAARQAAIAGMAPGAGIA